MPVALLLTGPPFSATLWTEVGRRLEGRGVKTEAIDLFDPAPETATIPALAVRLANHIFAASGPVALVAHGSALPIALAAAGRLAPDLLVLANGPLQGPDPITRALGLALRPTALAARTALHPALFLRWLWSSAGLRRAVVNPYVMDRDTVVAICGPLFRTAAHRQGIARYLQELRGTVDVPQPLPTPTLLAWGDDDALHPLEGARQLCETRPGVELHPIPGGRFLHPVERPWFLADLVADRLLSSPRAAPGG